MAYDKESTKTSFYELAPSLQQMLVDLVNDSQFQATKSLINQVYGRMGDIVITEGFHEPDGNTLGATNKNKLTVTNNKNVHLDLSNKVLEGYYDNKWNRSRIIYST